MSEKIDTVIENLEGCLKFALKIKKEGENEEQDVPSLIDDIVDTFKYMNEC